MEEISLLELLIIKQLMDVIPDRTLDGIDISIEKNREYLIRAIYFGYFGVSTPSADEYTDILDTLLNRNTNVEDDYVLYEGLDNNKFFFDIYKYVKSYYRPSEEQYELKIHNPTTGNNYDREFKFCLN